MTQKRLTDLRKRLTDLEGQRDTLAKRIADLERQQGDVVVGDDASETVAQLTEVSRELDTARRVVGPLEARISQVRADLGEAQTEEQRVQVSRLWAKERVYAETVVKLVADLQTALDDVAQARRDIEDLRGFSKAQVPTQLYQAVRATFDYWSMYGWNHDDGGSFRRDQLEQRERWARGEKDPPGEHWVAAMQDKKTREAYEKRCGVKVKGRGENLTVEADPRRLHTVGT